MISEARLARIEARLDALEGQRPGRKAKPVIVSEEGVCGIDPDRNSAVCKDASLWRRQKGCQGTACVRVASEYYGERRKAKRLPVDPS